MTVSPDHRSEIHTRNEMISQLSAKLKRLLPLVLAETGISSEASLHAKYGGKHAQYIDIKNAVINSPELFISLYLQGFEAYSTTGNHQENFRMLRSSPHLREYLYDFLYRTYLRNEDALSKNRPKIEGAEIWIGQNTASYGLLVTPRFNATTRRWENDKSEIRHFNRRYFTIGHVLETGLVVPGKPDTFRFPSAEEYLNFFLNVLVRNSGSKYEYAIAERYCAHVLSSSNVAEVPLLIPEFRYLGLAQKHEYRLDFCTINPHTLSKVGFELSPWSSHGYLRKTGQMSQAEINRIAMDNFGREMTKHKDFFRKHGVFVLIYTDRDLLDLDGIFGDIGRFLDPQRNERQVRRHIISEILGRTPLHP